MIDSIINKKGYRVPLTAIYVTYRTELNLKQMYIGYTVSIPSQTKKTANVIKIESN